MRYITKLFAHNERMVMLFDSHLGLIAIVLIGAVIVGTMGTVWHGDIKKSQYQQCILQPHAHQGTSLAKGAELGYFKLGSTVIMLFANHSTIAWLPKITVGNKIHYGHGLAERSAM